MGSLDRKLTRLQALSLAGSRGLALAAALGSVGGLGLQDASAGTTAVASALRSRALGGRLRFVVHLPASYSLDARRYPVVYFLHGLPASPSAYLHLDWVARALAQAGRDAIIVAPQGTRVPNGDPEYHNWGPGEDWETAIAEELPAWIDSSYRTLAERSGRAIVGYSAGGYGASIIVSTTRARSLRFSRGAATSTRPIGREGSCCMPQPGWRSPSTRSSARPRCDRRAVITAPREIRLIPEAETRSQRGRRAYSAPMTLKSWLTKMWCGQLTPM